MNELLLSSNSDLRRLNCWTRRQWIHPKFMVLCILAVLLCCVSVSYCADGLIGKWRALDQDNIIHGFSFMPELKFREDGTLSAGITYTYRVLDDSKFVWILGNGIEKIYKYQIWGDLLLIYSLEAPDNRARFKRVK